MKTTLHTLIDDLKKLKSKKGKLNPRIVLKTLEDHLHKEREQIYDAFTHGIKYGHSMFQTADYPHAHYYTGMHEETAMQIHKHNEKLSEADNRRNMSKRELNKLKKLFEIEK